MIVGSNMSPLEHPRSTVMPRPTSTLTHFRKCGPVGTHKASAVGLDNCVDEDGIPVSIMSHGTITQRGASNSPSTIIRLSRCVIRALPPKCPHLIPPLRVLLIARDDYTGVFDSKALADKNFLLNLADATCDDGYRCKAVLNGYIATPICEIATSDMYRDVLYTHKMKSAVRHMQES